MEQYVLLRPIAVSPILSFITADTNINFCKNLIANSDAKEIKLFRQACLKYFVKKLPVAN